MKFRGVTSLRKLLPIWATPNGTRTRRGVEDVFEFQEDALGGFGAEIGLDCIDGADFGRQHQIELTRLGKRAFFLGIGADDPTVMRNVKVRQRTIKGFSRRKRDLVAFFELLLARSILSSSPCTKANNIPVSASGA